jgi:hypothetical protein
VRVAAVEIHDSRACPAMHDTRTDAPRAEGVYQFARAYLCEDHREMWDREDMRAHRERGRVSVGAEDVRTM